MKKSASNFLQPAEGVVHFMLGVVEYADEAV